MCWDMVLRLVLLWFKLKKFLFPLLLQSDPMVVVYTKKRDGTLEELGRTEVIMNSLDPAWIKKITVAYHFEIVQPLM